MTDQSNLPQVDAGAQPVTQPQDQTPDWRTLDFAADCLCTRSVAQPDAQTASKRG
ncbi:hypothetical protein [Pseudooceanicola sp. MF1-13]|uniref:hypothetical protein n=1 Tax=Pseudooceanicola sp. MF1-13 TaxID=3379095 RepID=UPI0038917A52